MSRVTGDYQKLLRHMLKDEELAYLYICEALGDFFENNRTSQQVLLASIRNVIESHNSYTEITQQSGITKKELQNMLATDSKPRLSTILQIFKGLNYCVNCVEATNAPDEIEIVPILLE